MKVAHVIGAIIPSAGSTYSVLSLVDALAGHGVAGEVHTSKPVPASIVARGDVVGYAVWPIARRIHVSPAMRRGLAVADGDILHNNGVWTMPNRYAAAVARERRIPLVSSPRGMLSAWAVGFSRRRKQLAWSLGSHQAAKRVVCFHATSEAEAQDIRRLGFRQPIAVVPNGIHLPDLGPEAPESPSRRRKVLFLSRLHPKKGIPILLRAWQAVELYHPDWDLIVSGPDEIGHLEELRTVASELKLRRVSFPGPAYGPAKTARFREADLFVLPTHSENFGVVVAEAMAHRLPVITTKGTPWDQLEPRRCGWRIQLSEGHLAATLRAAMNIPDHQRHEMGSNGRRWMEQAFAWPRIAEQMKGVYTWLLGGGAPPAWVMND
jgi:glycosyltransferase involved in cell wall biosynthesis